MFARESGGAFAGARQHALLRASALRRRARAMKECAQCATILRCASRDVCLPLPRRGAMFTLYDIFMIAFDAMPMVFTLPLCRALLL